jgi:hypothetical protein
MEAESPFYNVELHETRDAKKKAQRAMAAWLAKKNKANREQFKISAPLPGSPEPLSRAEKEARRKEVGEAAWILVRFSLSLCGAQWQVRLMCRDTVCTTSFFKIAWMFASPTSHTTLHSFSYRHALLLHPDSAFNLRARVHPACLAVTSVVAGAEGTGRVRAESVNI